MSPIFDSGDPVPLSVTVTNAAGTPQDATLVVLTITLPDGTTSTPAVTAAGSGVYTATGPSTQAGRYGVRWVATGTNASAYTDAYDVDDASPTGIVSLADAKAHLNITLTDNDEELRAFIDAATDFIEGRIGPVVRRTVTETVTPAGGRLFLSGPVISVTTMTSAYGYSGTYTVGDWTIDGASLVANYGVSTYCWPVTVTYVGGRVIVPALIRQAALDYVKWLWESQRGPTPPPPGSFGADEFAVTAPATAPYRILQALEPYTTPVVA